LPRQPQDNPKGKLTTGRVFRRHTAHFALWGRPHLLGHTNLWYIGAESDFSQPFLNKNDQFTKTGSGQISEEPKSLERAKMSFSAAALENATWYAGVQGYKGARWGKETVRKTRRVSNTI